ncbi:UPF0426 protein, chloroplastic-like protein [Drosera capensis]
MAAAAAATLLINHSFSTPCRARVMAQVNQQRGLMARSRLRVKSNRGGVRAFFINPIEDPIVKEALKEPVAFMGGVFAGFLRLDLNDDPLKEWLQRIVEAAGITEEEISDKGSKPDEDAPQQIEIE